LCPWRRAVRAQVLAVEKLDLEAVKDLAMEEFDL
jgi:hypothetical protein